MAPAPRHILLDLPGRYLIKENRTPGIVRQRSGNIKNALLTYLFYGARPKNAQIPSVSPPLGQGGASLKHLPLPMSAALSSTGGVAASATDSVYLIPVCRARRKCAAQVTLPHRTLNGLARWRLFRPSTDTQSIGHTASTPFAVIKSSFAACLFRNGNRSFAKPGSKWYPSH